MHRFNKMTHQHRAVATRGRAHYERFRLYARDRSCVISESLSGCKAIDDKVHAARRSDVIGNRSEGSAAAGELTAGPGQSRDDLDVQSDLHAVPGQHRIRR